MTFRQFWCWLRRGHDDVLAFGYRRQFLRCTSCKRETAGIPYSAVRPRQTCEGAPERHVLRPTLRIVERKRA